MSNWKVKGTYLEVCNCEAICTCTVFSPPTEGHCIVMLGWRVDEGNFDGADLGGLNTVILATAPGNMKDGGWKVALYTDSRANEDQNNALMGIFSGEAGGHMANLAPLIGEVMGARQADINFDINGEKMSLTVDGMGEAELEPILGQNDGPVTLSGHPLAASPGYPARIGRANKLEVNDYDIQLSISGKAGMSAPFVYQSE